MLAASRGRTARREKKKKQETKTDDGVVQARTKETDGHVSKEKKIKEADGAEK